MPQAPPQLDYAAAPSRHRWLTRRTIWLSVTLVVGIAVIKWFMPAVNHVRMLYYQHRCLVHVDPPEKVVVEDPPGLTKVQPVSDWVEFYALFSPPGGQFKPTVFLGKLRQNDGSLRLVEVDASGLSYTTPGVAILSLDYQVIAPGGLWKRPKYAASATLKVPFTMWRREPPLRVHAAQIEHDSPNHFTIELEWPDGKNTLDGWLEHDDTLRIELRFNITPTALNASPP